MLYIHATTVWPNKGVNGTYMDLLPVHYKSMLSVGPRLHTGQDILWSDYS